MLARCLFIAIGGFLSLTGCSRSGGTERAPHLTVVPIEDTERWTPNTAHGGATGLGGAPSVSRSGFYPKGPYGSRNPELGDIVPDVEFEGFVSPPSGGEAQDGEYGRLSLGEIRKGSEQYLIVHVSALWCSACLIAAEVLSERDDEVQALGGRSIELLMDGAEADYDPSRDELVLWSKTGGLGIPTVMAGEPDTRNVFPTRERVYILDLDTMAVVWRAEGFYSDTTITGEAINALIRSQD